MLGFKQLYTFFNVCCSIAGCNSELVYIHKKNYQYVVETHYCWFHFPTEFFSFQSEKSFKSFNATELWQNKLACSFIQRLILCKHNTLHLNTKNLLRTLTVRFKLAPLQKAPCFLNRTVHASFQENWYHFVTFQLFLFPSKRNKIL